MEPELPEEFIKLLHASRPLRNLYVAVAKVIETDKYLRMTDKQFIGQVMKHSSGSVSPDTVRSIYNNLMLDAGINPTFETDKEEN